MSSLIPSFQRSLPVKPSINIGACLDIPTGTYITGLHGESILNGGLAAITGVVGIGNNFKSTIAHFMNLSAMDKIMPVVETSISTYDTEVNINESELKRFYTNRPNFPSLKDKDLIDLGLWQVTDKSVYYANEWYEIYRDFMKGKRGNDKVKLFTPFPDRDGTSTVKFPVPTFTEVDSFSEFETADIAKIQEDNELGDSGGNTIHMRKGLVQTRFLMELPALVGSGGGYVTLTAHVGKKIQMASGPMPQPPEKILQHLKNGDAVKGVSSKFFFLLHNCWHARNAAPYINQSTKAAEYPRDGEDNLAGDTDLNIVTVTQLRGKNGSTGYSINLLVSQRDGVLPSLTEFHYCKTNGRWGLGGNDKNYFLELCPEVKLMRTTVRSKLENDPLLARAMNITSELLQIKQFWPAFPKELMCTPLELYEDLKKLGYDWKDLLNTRGWWTLNNDEFPIPMLSTLDLLKMRKGEYFPYWMNTDKTRKNKYKINDSFTYTPLITI